MKILITGAHFTTAVAVIEELQKIPNTELIYVGRKTTREGDSSSSPESKILPEMGIKFIPITTGRLQRSFTIYTIPSLLKIPIGIVQAFWILLSEKPDRILSFGGYVAVPIVIVSWLMSIRIIIHEQTLVTGLANKISSRFADKILISFDSKNNFDPKKVILTGNPLRREILNVIPAKEIVNRLSTMGIQKTESAWIPDQVGDDNSMNIQKMFTLAKKEKKPVIFITGGNQGSHVINLAVENVLDKLTKLAYIVHQTGDSKFKDFERLEKQTSSRYLVSKFIYDEMPYLLKNADLVVSRAGINTLTELAFFGTLSLVIPVPYLYSDEQNQNAKYFEQLGLVTILPQNKLSGKSLLENIVDCLKKEKPDIRKTKPVVVSGSAKKIALETLTLV